VPLAADEIFLAQAHYPIVFTAGGPGAPVALVGVAPDKNLFVGADGTWRKGAYVPAYVRRYPFIFVRGAENRLALAIDEAAECYAAKGGRALFEKGEPAEGAKQALQFCAAFQQQFERAQAFTAALDEQKLLVEYRADLRTPQGAGMRLRGFRVIDETKFNALPDEVILDWRRKGYLPLVYGQLMSMHRWGALATLAGEAGEAGNAT
jgi:SapC